MGVEAETYGALLSSAVLGKIPHNIRLVVSHEMGDGEQKLEDFMKIVLSELQHGRELLPAIQLARCKRKQ